MTSDVALVLLGGRDEERRDSAEVLTADGACHLVDGFPAPMPEGERSSCMEQVSKCVRSLIPLLQGRTGHMAASVLNTSLLVCGGLTARKPSALSRKCWVYNKGSNVWKQVGGEAYPLLVYLKLII